MNTVTETVETKTGDSVDVTLKLWEKHGNRRVYVSSSYGKLQYDLVAGEFTNCKQEINNAEIRRTVKDLAEKEFNGSDHKESMSMLDFFQAKNS